MRRGAAVQPAGLAGLVAVALCALPSPGSGQARLAGVVSDTAGEALGGVAVTLHRLTQEGGANVAVDTTTAEGRFAFELTDASPETVHFAAVRVQGVLFVGPLFNGPAPPADYRISIESGHLPGSIVMADGAVLDPGAAPGPDAAPLAGAAAGPEPPSAKVALGVVLLVTGVLLAGVAWLLGRRRELDRRELLVELAELEEWLAGQDATEAGHADALRERDLLRRRLARALPS